MSDETPPVQGLNYPVVVHDQPFASTVALMQGLHGQSLGELVTACKLPPAVTPYVRVWINDVEYLPDQWATTVPAVGSHVYIRVVPQKSGKDIFRAIAMIVITVVAYSVAGPLGGSIASGLGITSTLGVNIVTGLVAAGLATVGYLALNALVPPPGLKNNRQDERDRLTGSSNAFAPYGNIPRVFGKRRVYPMLAARPYSEIQGDDEYLRMALVVGWGPLEITNLRIGETPITAYEGVSYEIREGWSNDAPLTLFTKTVTEDNFTIRLEPYQTTNYYPGGYGYSGDYWQYNGDLGTYDSVDPNTVTSTNDYGYRTTATNAIEFSVDIAFPQGLFYFDSKGNQKEATVTFSVQYAPVGTSNWVNAAWANSADTGFGTAGQITVKGSSSTAIRRSGRVVLPSAGQYQVRVRRTTANGGSKYVDLSWWTALRTIKADYPVNQKNVSLIALRIKASNQLNGVPQTINCDAESYLPVYSGGAWTYTKTANPAWAFADILRRRGGETFIPDSRIDLTAISDWAAACAASAPAGVNEPRWTFNAVLEGGSVIDALRTIGGNARALYTMRDGKHSVVRDIQQTVPIQHITPRNSTGYSGSKLFLDYPHALRVLFINKDNGYQTDERVVYDDGYTAANATRFETLELVGCTSPTQAYREARYHMAVAKLRPEQHTVQMDIEALRCTLGDLVMFSHDAIGIGIMATRVKSVTTSAGNVTTVTLDDDVYFETGTSYVLRTRKSDGTTKLQAVNNPGTGYASVLTITTPATAANSPAVGDLVIFGTSTSVTAPMIVRKIEPSEDFNVTVTLVDAQDGVYTADTSAIPAFNSFLSTTSAPGSGEVPPVYISTVRSDDSVVIVNADGSLNYRIFVGVQQPESTQQERIDRFEVQYRIKNTEFWEVLSLERANPFGYIDRVVVGDIYQLRSRGIAESGAAGTWSTTVEHTVVGKTNFSGVATNVSATAIPGGIRLAWDNPTNNDLWETEIYENTVNNSATATVFAKVTATTYDRLGLESANGVRYYWLKSVDTSGNKGAFSAGVSATALNRVLALNLTNEAVSLAADAAGTVASFATAVGTLTVFDGNTDVTANATLSATATNCTGTVNTAANTPVSGQPKGYYRVTAASADNATLAITAAYNGQSITKEFTVAKARAGTNGSNGTSAVEVTLTKAATTVFAYADGSVPSFSGVDGQLTVYDGVTDVTASATLSATASGLTGTINTATNTPVSGQSKGYYRVTAMSGDTGTLTLSAVYGGNTYTRVFSVSKVKTGYEIVAALPSTNLFAGRMVFLTTDNKLYRYTGSAWTAAVPAADVTGQIVASQIADAQISTAKFATGIEPVTVVSSVPGTKSTNSIFNTADGKLYRWNGTAYVATVPTADLSGTVSDAQIAGLAASKVTGQLSNAQIADLAATKISGQLSDTQLAAISAAKITGQVVSSQIADAAISTAKFASGLEPVTVVTGSTLPTTKSTNSIYLTGTGKLYRWVGSAYSAEVPTTDLSGTIADAQIAGLAATKVTGQLTDGQLAGISAAKLTGQITGTQITDGAISTAKLSAGSVTTAVLAADAVTADKIAANAVTASEIAAGAITTAKLAAGAVTANEIAAGSITGDRIAANTITGAKIAADTITAGNIATGAITASEIASGAITTEKLLVGGTGNAINDDPNTQDISAWVGPGLSIVTDNTSPVGNTVLRCASGGATVLSRRMPLDASRNYEYRIWTRQESGSSTTYLTVAFYDANDNVISGGGSGWSNGTYNYFALVNSYLPASWTEYRISFGPNESATIPTNSKYIRIGLLSNYTGSGTQLATGIRLMLKSDGTLITDGAITTGKIAAGAITATQIAADTITSDKIAANAITASELSAGAVTAGKIAAGAVTANEIAANAITAAKIDAGAVTTAKLAAGAVTASTIAADTITGDKIAANTITGGKIAADTITAGNIAAGAISADEIAANAVNASKIAADSITSDKIAANAITAGKIAAGQITADKIATNAVTADKIEAGAITAAKLAATSVITASAQIGDGVITNAKIDNLNVNKLTGDITTYVTGQGSSNGGYVPTTETTYLTVQLPPATHPNGHKPYVQVNVLSGTTLASNFFINVYSAPVGNGQSVSNITVTPNVQDYWYWYEPEIQYYEQIGWILTFYNAQDIEVGDTLTNSLAEVGTVESVYMNGTQQIVYVAAWSASLGSPYVRARPSLGNGVVGTYTQVRGVTVVNQSQRSTSIFVPELTTSLGRSYQVRCRAGTASRVIITSIDILAMGIR